MIRKPYVKTLHMADYSEIIRVQAAFTIGGSTNEVMREIIARQSGL